MLCVDRRYTPRFEGRPRRRAPWRNDAVVALLETAPPPQGLPQDEKPPQDAAAAGSKGTIGTPRRSAPRTRAAPAGAQALPRVK